MLLLCPVLLSSSGDASEFIPAPTTAADATRRWPHLRGVTLTRANLRQAPSIQSEILAVAKEAALLEVLEEGGAWYRVRTEAGVEAWVHKSLLRLQQVPLEQEPPRLAVPTASPTYLSLPVISPAAVATPYPISEAPAPWHEPSAPSLMAQPLDVDEPYAPPLPLTFPVALQLILGHLQGTSSYVLTGLAVVLIFSTGLQLRAARQLKRTMRDMDHIIEMIEAVQAETPAAPARSAPPAIPGPALPLSPVERIVIETIAEHGELDEHELRKLLEEKDFPRVLIKTVIGDLIRKTAADGLPWVEASYAQGRFTYGLRVQQRPDSRHQRGAE
jgi:hypothetical protein